MDNKKMKRQPQPYNPETTGNIIYQNILSFVIPIGIILFIISMVATGG